MATIRGLQNEETILTSRFGGGNASTVPLFLIQLPLIVVWDAQAHRKHYTAQLPREGKRFRDSTQLSMHGDPRRARPIRGPGYGRDFSMTSTDDAYHTSQDLAGASVTQRSTQCMAIPAERGPFGAQPIDETSQ